MAQDFFVEIIDAFHRQNLSKVLNLIGKSCQRSSLVTIPKYHL
jgi:hypothetical protein